MRSPGWPKMGTVRREMIEFVHDLDASDLPAPVTLMLRRCLTDLVGVAAAGTATRLSGIVRGHVVRHFGAGGQHARLLFDGRAVSRPGAALANAATIDSVDGHDGHRLTKGHAGAAVLPAALAFLDGEQAATTTDLLGALAVGYELATRAGIALHATAADYHSSGAWNALGAAAVGARAAGLDGRASTHALGIAEYHAPRAPMMRCIEHPSMVKDSSGWGAHAGVSAALLAADGFTGPPPSLLGGDGQDDLDDLDDLGTRWLLLETYLKPYPVCRWAHPAVRAALDVVLAHRVGAESVEHVEVRTFDPATGLTARTPEDTEQAQYSLTFPVAVAVAHGELDPAAVTDPAGAGDAVRRLSVGMRVEEAVEMTERFPAARLADVTLVLTDGRRLSSGPTSAPGDAEQPLTAEQVDAKFRDYCVPLLGGARAERLLHALRGARPAPLAEALADLWSSPVELTAPRGAAPPGRPSP